MATPQHRDTIGVRDTAYVEDLGAADLAPPPERGIVLTKPLVLAATRTEIKADDKVVRVRTEHRIVNRDHPDAEIVVGHVGDLVTEGELARYGLALDQVLEHGDAPKWYERHEKGGWKAMRHQPEEAAS